MKSRIVVLGLCLAACAAANGQKQMLGAGVPTPAKKIPYYIDTAVFNPFVLVPPPPAQTSDITKSELALEHRVEQTRTPQEVAAAQYDDLHEDIFIYQALLGDKFIPAELPVTSAFSAHLRNEAGVVTGPLKTHYMRPRPGQFDKTLHPVCKADSVQAYPSGHTMVGYLMALALTEMVPEKHAQILARADVYAHNRIVCGVHYPSDLEASKIAAYATFGYLLGTPHFQKDLAAATEEVRRHLGLGTLPVE